MGYSIKVNGLWNDMCYSSSCFFFTLHLLSLFTLSFDLLVGLFCSRLSIVSLFLTPFMYLSVLWLVAHFCHYFSSTLFISPILIIYLALGSYHLCLAFLFILSFLWYSPLFSPVITFFSLYSLLFLKVFVAPFYDYPQLVSSPLLFLLHFSY